MKKIKRAFKKLKYLDKTQSSYFAIMTFIATFCMFTGVTYSYFTLTEHLNAATLTIAKLNYELTSTDTDYNDGVITVPANTTKTLTLSLKSLNRLETKYALNYETTNPNVKVYYKGDNIQNTEGIIGSTNSIIEMTIVIENVSNENATVTLNTDCGYLQNTLTSNITEEFRFDVPKAVLAIENNQRPAGVQLGTPDFSQVATTDEGVYASEDDYGVSYYYRGAVENNYIYYAGYYWRIIRVNGDGSLRIIYDGTSAHANGTSNSNRLALTSVAWNSNDNDAKYVGYMYGGSNGTASTSKIQAQTNETSSNMKTQLESWYKTNIADKGYGSAVADRIFCNDRSTPNSSYATGYGTNVTHYGAFTRFLTPSYSWNTTNPTPTYRCNQAGDKFTTSTSTGNGKLNYPVGLITADEIVAAGSGIGTSNSNYYLYKGSWYWSFSPFIFNGGFAFVFYVNSSGGLDYYGGGGAGGVAPVINLSAEYAKNLSGDGTKENPYREGFSLQDGLEAIEKEETPKNVNTNTPDFSQAATTDEGIYAMADDYGTSYYFRGAVTNNYVKFAGFYWRIIRINGDGSVRMIYDGTSAHANGEASEDRLALTNVAWNENLNDVKYVGYMYGGNNGEASTSKEQAQTNETSSNMKTQLEDWYKINIEDRGYSSAVADKIFCNDRSTPDTSYAVGYGTNETHYGAFTRFLTPSYSWNTTNPTPTYRCNQAGDKFTTSTSTGNGKLSYPVGLITPDEIVAAGSGIGKSNGNYYLYKGSWYWSFSPSGFGGSSASVFYVGYNGALSDYYVNDTGGVAPVINLSAEYAKTLKGTGTTSSPYTNE